MQNFFKESSSSALNVVYMPAQKDNSVKLRVHKSLLTHGK